MDRSEVKRIVDENITRMVDQLGIGYWRGEVVYGPCQNPDWKASCQRIVDYDQFIITIDHEKAETPEDVLRSLRHELLHVLISPFDLYRDVVTQMIAASDGDTCVAERVWTHAVEQVVLRLERMLDHCLKVPLFEEGFPGPNTESLPV